MELVLLCVSICACNAVDVKMEIYNMFDVQLLYFVKKKDVIKVWISFLYSIFNLTWVPYKLWLWLRNSGLNSPHPRSVDNKEKQFSMNIECVLCRMTIEGFIQFIYFSNKNWFYWQQLAIFMISPTDDDFSFWYF